MVWRQISSGHPPWHFSRVRLEQIGFRIPRLGSRTKGRAMRTIPEWIGATPDTPPPPRVQIRVYLKHHGKCPKRTRPLQPKSWACDHIVALINGGENRESNLQPLCVRPCHSNK